MTTVVSHADAFKAQAEFPVEAKIKVGNDIWSSETAGSRLYASVLSKKPTTIQKAIDLASELKVPFTAKQVQGHLRWLFTAGELEVDGRSYTPKTAKAAKAKADAKAPKPKAAAKPEAKAVATRQRAHVKRRAA